MFELKIMLRDAQEFAFPSHCLTFNLTGLTKNTFYTFIEMLYVFLSVYTMDVYIDMTWI